MHKRDGLGTQIYKGDPRPRIQPGVMALSAMGLKLGVFGVFADHTRKNAKQMHLRSSCAGQPFTRVCLHDQTAVDTGDYTHLTKYSYFDYMYRKNQNTPNLSPMSGIKWRMFWDLSCIYICDRI